MGKLVWLASYPKSGNTWLRIFLTNYQRNADAPADINQLDVIPIASSRPLFENVTALESSDLTCDEVDVCRPDVYRTLAAQQRDTLLLKVHDAYTSLPDGRALLPADVTAGAIYLVRNPLDVAVSLAAHTGHPLERVITEMGQATFALTAKHSLSEQLRQKLGSWSSHVQHWLAAATHFPVCCIRYEDMLGQPVPTFTKVIRFLNQAEDAQRLQKALAFSQFEGLQQQERAHGFQEHPGLSAAFFRQGRAEGWRARLEPAHIAQLIADHGAVMRRFGYLAENGEVRTEWKTNDEEPAFG